MEEKKSFLKQTIDLESPNKNIVPVTTSLEGDGKLSKFIKMEARCLSTIAKIHENSFWTFLADLWPL